MHIIYIYHTFSLCEEMCFPLQTSDPISTQGHPKEECHGQNDHSITRIHKPILGISINGVGITMPHYSQVLIVTDMAHNSTLATYGL